MDDRAGAKVVKADVPLSEMFGYVTTLRTIHQDVQLQLWNFLTMQKLLEMLLRSIAKVKGNVTA